MHIPVTGFAAAVCGLLLVVLALRIVKLRIQHKVALGDGGVAVLNRAIRVHGNTSEQAPIFLLQCLCYEIYVGASPFLIGVVAVFLFARIVFALGLSIRTINLARRAGAALTFASQMVLGVALLVQVVSTLTA